jgi:hypothetical protein
MDDEVCSAGGCWTLIIVQGNGTRSQKAIVHELTPTAFFIGKQWAKSWIADKNVWIPI